VQKAPDIDVNCRKGLVFSSTDIKLNLPAFLGKSLFSESREKSVEKSGRQEE
jgi:hypothetical protein